MHTTAGNSFLVYWQQAGAQLFAFTVCVQADTPAPPAPMLPAPSPGRAGSSG